MRGFGNSLAQQMQQQQQQQHQRMQQGAWWMEQQQQRQRMQAQFRQQVAETALRPKGEKKRASSPGGLRGAPLRSPADIGTVRPPRASVASRSSSDDVQPRTTSKDGKRPRPFVTLLKWTALAVGAVIIVAAFPPAILILGAVAIGSILVTLIRPKTIVGEARQIQQEHQNDVLGAVTVLRFRVDRFDKNGNRRPPVPVELHGKFIKGSLQEGDWVEVKGRRRSEAYLRPKRIRNLTTGERIHGKRRLGAAIGFAISWAFFLAFVGGVIALVVAISS